MPIRDMLNRLNDGDGPRFVGSKKRLNSRQKGASAERELASYLREKGFDAKRGQQHKGGADSPDVTGLPGFHLEVKRVEAGNLYNWMDQSVRDAAGINVPIVVHRRNRRDWVTILRLDDFLDLVKDNG